MAIATSVDIRVTAVLAFYVVLMVVYSLWLKVYRAARCAGVGRWLCAADRRRRRGGVNAVRRRELLAFFVFVFFSLAMVKRYAELSLLRLAGVTTAPARCYSVEDSGVAHGPGRLERNAFGTGAGTVPDQRGCRAKLHSL